MGYSWSQQDETVGGGMLRIASEQIAKAILSADALDEPPARRIHAARRRCKRLRGLFRLVRPDFSRYRKANAQVRDAAARLSSVRDDAVLLDTLDTLSDWAGQPAPPHEDDPVDPHAEEAALAAFRDDMLALAAEAKTWSLAKIDRKTLGRGLKRCYADARDALAKCREDPTDDAFHNWRKQVKYHSFHLLLVKKAFGAGHVAEIEQVERLAELLGRHHDLAVLRQTAEQQPERLGEGVDARFITINAPILQQQLAARALSLGDTIFVRPPRLVRQTLETRWQEWWDEKRATEAA
jgi:CHAD domain-containing protein